MQGIKFNQDGITAILKGRKTMTRRPIKDIGKEIKHINYGYKDRVQVICDDSEQYFYSKYKIGETLFVKETFVIETAQFNEDGAFEYHDEPIIHYKADKKDLTWFDEWEDEINVPWKPSTHMNKEISRIFLKITNIKVERLQDISRDDCYEEGIDIDLLTNDIDFENEEKCIFEATIWNKLPYQAPYDWDSNPYVFVYEFERIENV